MSDSTQKPINDQNQIPAGDAPAEAMKPKEPSHEEILTGFKSQAKARKILAGSIASNASKRIAKLEARKEDIANAAKVERESTLNRLEHERKEKEEFLQNSRQEDLNEIHNAAAGSKADLKEQFETLKANLSDQSAIEQAERELADKIKEIDELESKADATREEAHEKYMYSLQEMHGEEVAEAEKSYLASMSIINHIDEEIANVKSEKETRLKELWSSKLEEKVDETIEDEPSEEDAKPIVGSGVKKAAIAAAAVLALYLGSNYERRMPTYQHVSSLSISSDSVNSFMPLASTGLVGVKKPEVKAPKPAVGEKKQAKIVVNKKRSLDGDLERALKRAYSSHHSLSEKGSLFYPRSMHTITEKFCLDAAIRMNNRKLGFNAAQKKELVMLLNLVAQSCHVKGFNQSILRDLDSVREDKYQPTDIKNVSKKISKELKRLKVRMGPAPKTMKKVAGTAQKPTREPPKRPPRGNDSSLSKPGPTLLGGNGAEMKPLTNGTTTQKSVGKL